jgi:3-hydroxyacyl-CoA dehydrogenase/enoyl-CoA hydratase/3-hydroxybutyryl-CoA epimerase
MLDNGFAIESIDNALVKFGMPMGPFRLMDEIGLDVCYHVANDLKNRLNINSPGINVLVSKIGQGELGKKTGKGFYTYKRGKAIKNKPTEDASPVVEVLISAMIDESKAILKEQVIDSSDSLDFAMIMGTGWAPFRGGPVRFDEQRYINTV